MTPTICLGPISPSEYLSLYDIYAAARGGYWTWSGTGSAWYFPENLTVVSEQNLSAPCSKNWEGVDCLRQPGNSSFPCYVSSLSFVSMNLSGTISPSLGNFTQLVMLDFDNNLNLVGSIPETIGQLTTLESIYIIYNGLTQSLPSALFSASSLREIIISSNRLSGTIPPSIGNLINLESVELTSSFLTGSFPTTIAFLTNLQSIQLFSNYLSGRLDALKNLELADLVADANYFTGELVAGWRLSAGQVSFSVATNLLEGALPSGFFRPCPLGSLDLSSNFFTGTFPTSVSLLFALESLLFNENAFSGTLPSELGRLSAMQTLFANNNKLTGTFPESLFFISVLLSLYLDSNWLTGPFPEVASNPHFFEFFVINSNLFSSSLPSTMGNFTVLVFSAESNYFSGSIPSQFFASQYDIASNFLSGTIPEVLATSTVINALVLGNNFLTGTVSPSFFANNVFQLDLSLNQLHGTLPILRPDQLFSLNLCCNSFTGPLIAEPAIRSSLISEQFIVSNNSFTGTIPSALLYNPYLESIALDNNFFTGTIPPLPPGSNNSNLLLTTIVLSSNALTGTLPESMVYLSSVSNLNVGNNMISGVLPLSLQNNSVPSQLLNQFHFGNNYLHGDLAILSILSNITVFGGELNLLTGSLEPLAHLSSLQQLVVFGNSLTGSLPSAFSTFSSLKSILLQNNSLVGEVTGIFNADVQATLTAVDLSSNDFTGPIPSEVFRLPLIESFASIKTCLSGSLPEAELCNATTLKYLLMDGATAGTHCQRKFSILKSSDAYVSTNGPMRGGIPACLWQLPSLEVLHLSSNGLSGTIAAPPASSALREVVLSFNQLSGTIPNSLQGLSFDILDLANNRFKGTYQGVMNNTGAQLALKNNRLSGMMSSSFQQATDIDVMQGNLFDCDNENPKPPHDPNSAETYCGSNQLDISSMVMGFTIAFLLSITLFMLCLSRKRPGLESSELQQSLRTREKDDELTIVLGVVRRALLLFSYGNAARLELDIENIIFATECRTLHLRLFLRLLRVCVWAAATVCFATILFLIPLYIALKLSFGQQYSTHTYQYQWLVSAAFLSGVPPAIVVIIAWFMIALAVWSVFKWTNLNDATTSQLQVDSSSFSSIHDKQLFITRIRYAVSGLIVILNFVIIFGINYAYLTINLSTAYPSSVKTLTQIAVAAFKFLWDVTVIPTCTSELRKRIGDESQSSDAYVILKFLCYIINFVIIPGVVTVVVDSNCFLDLFVPDQEVVEAFTYSLASFQPCVTIPAIKINNTILEMTIEVPPTTICLSYGTPQQLTTLFNPPFSYSYQCGSAILTSYVPVLMYAYSFQGIFMPALFGASFYFFMRQARDKTTDCSDANNNGRSSWLESVLGRCLLGIVNPWGTTKRGESLLGGSTIVAILMQSLLILLTFGLASPPLAALVLIVVVAEVARYFVLVECYLRFRGEIERPMNCQALDVSSLRLVAFNANISVAAGELNDACRDLWRATGICFWIAFFVSSAFWGLMVFDMVGNTSANSPLKAIWPPVTVLLLPWLTALTVFVYSRATQSRRRGEAERSVVRENEFSNESSCNNGMKGVIHLNSHDGTDNEILVNFGVDGAPPMESRPSLLELSSRN